MPCIQPLGPPLDPEHEADRRRRILFAVFVCDAISRSPDPLIAFIDALSTLLERAYRENDLEMEALVKLVLRRAWGQTTTLFADPWPSIFQLLGV